VALPSWPIPSFRPLQAGTSPLQRMLDPLATEMEGGNLRQRSRPGDNVGTIQQTIQMPLAEYETLVVWVKTTLNNGTARFTMDVWLGTGFANKVCQFVKPGSSLTAQFIPTDAVNVSMTLRIYDV
jgi:hypothetical protein